MKNKERIELQKDIEFYKNYADNEKNPKVKRVNAKLKIKKLRTKINSLIFPK